MKKKFGKHYYFYSTFGKTKGDIIRKESGLFKRAKIQGINILTKIYPTVSGYELYWKLAARQPNGRSK